MDDRVRRARASRFARAARATGSPGGSKKLQDVFVDAKVPRAERDAWPVVVRDEEVVAVPGIVEDARGTGDAHVMKTELERAVGEVLIDADSLRARIAELGEEISAALRRARTCS